ncbi:transporter substrate-binding domain-containing protein [Breznakiella homolactica]|uniref:Transporter substrate-binding domain-containing protein n=1 Tax=Breznakiella homolactica TaxID=2798577 RepID=A0A7T8BAD7_9SPIR|nr:transporter substrate-binding domain-containing protein [Breznakiella homolactica]QQO09261.1 transporter substrate-binding domain-containing protein [Breznakiella homolactica]
MKLYKKLMVFAVLAAMALPVFAGGGEEKDTRLDNIRKSGKLVIGTSADYPPYEFHYLKNGQDVIGGFDIAIAEALAKDLGVTLEIKDMQFDGLLAALQAGTIDIVISGMSPTAERRKSVDFSTIYYYATHGVIVRQGDLAKYATVAALKDARLSAQKGTIQVGIAKTQIMGMSEEDAEKAVDVVKEVGSIKNLILDLKNGNVDAIVAELPVAQAYVRANADLGLAAPTFRDDDGGSAIAIKKGNPSLVTAVNTTLERLMAEGKIEEFFAEAQAIQEEQGQ